MADDRHGIFAGSDPYALLQNWIDAATAAEPNDPNAMTLATVDAGGMPNARIVLLKGIEAGRLLFYTNYESIKAQELEAAGRAALCFHWKSLRRQVRVRGHVERATADESDAYYASRNLGSRLGAWASQQSRPLQNRATLEARVAEMAERFADAPPRPPHWGGYALTPVTFEFWADGEDRLHDRFLWNMEESGWAATRLYP